MERSILIGLAQEALQAKRRKDMKKLAGAIVNDVICRRVDYNLEEMRTSAEKEKYIQELQGDIEELIQKSTVIERNDEYAVCRKHCGQFGILTSGN